VDSYIIPIELTQTLPIEEVLQILKFDEISKYGLPTKRWGAIEVSAGPWIGCWQLLIYINIHSKQTIYVPQERCIGIVMKPIDLLAIIYNTCDSLFRNEEPPIELLWGKIHQEQYWKKQRQEEEKRPKVWAEREFFRFCISYIEKMNDWSEEDYDVELTHTDGQLKIRAKQMQVCCPAIGTFHGTLTISARQLYRKMPKRFLANTVRLIVMPEAKVIIESTQFPAIWAEDAGQ